MTNKPDLESIEARVAAATPGPWHYSTESNEAFLHDNDDEVMLWAGSTEDQVSLTEGDWKFISYSITDIPQLIKAYREQQEALKKRDSIIDLLETALNLISETDDSKFKYQKSTANLALANLDAAKKLWKLFE